MAEYIDREEAKKMVCQYSVFRAQLGGLMDVVSFLDDQPTVDAVPVVRCKDCKYYTPYVDYYDGKTYNTGVCKHYNQILFDNNFCSFGVREGKENV